MALEKQQAVEDENYERAKLKKFQITELRTNLYKDLDLINLLSESAPFVESVQPSGDCIMPPFPEESLETKQKLVRPDPIRLQALAELSIQSSLIQSTTETNHRRSPSPNRRHSSSPSRRGTLHLVDPDERPLPALCRSNVNHSRSAVSKARPLEPDDDKTSSDPTSVVSFNPVQPYSANAADRSVPVQPAGHVLTPIGDEATEAFESEEWEDDENQPEDGDQVFGHTEPTDSIHTGQTNQPEPLSESNRRQASVAIDVFGLDLVTMALSKLWTFREKSLLEIEKRVTASRLPPPASLPDTAEPDPRAELRATTFILKRALDDPPLVIDFVERYAIPRPELHYALDKLLPVLFRRTGDTAVRIREVAKKQILVMAQWPQVGTDCNGFLTSAFCCTQFTSSNEYVSYPKGKTTVTKTAA
ncbi:unnamed protein product [Echinostoma caproni]|uniref:Uncharacterized protein n=1 Tax=Echinostoma caproni TaxID=27848 RepID=A0A3P8GM16_9TREM|nr:unnamed protein product [Echinostoma caproni]